MNRAEIIKLQSHVGTVADGFWWATEHNRLPNTFAFADAQKVTLAGNIYRRSN